MMQCFHPIRIRDPNHLSEYMMVPCGQCFACQSRRREDWFLRIKYELNKYPVSYTVTLTYDDVHLPDAIPFYDKDPLMDIAPGESYEKDDVCFYYHPINVRDVQLFLKRLRKMGYKFRYFGVGEYGGKTARPHYHIIFFFDYPLSKIRFQTDILKQWPYGYQIVVDETNDDCIGYTLKYCLKFYNVKQPSPKIFLSKRPFIGEGYFKDSTISYLRITPGDVVPTMVGKRRLPRLFRDKIYDDDMKEANSEVLQEFILEQHSKDAELSQSLGITPEELQIRRRQVFTKKCVRAIKKKSL